MSTLTRLASAFTLCGALALTGCANHHEDDAPQLTPAQFMAKMRAQPGVTALPDGVLYKVLHSGPKDGDSPRKGRMMMVIYEGRLPDGAIFDSSEEHGAGAYMQMPLDGVIQGWMDTLPLMHVGDEWVLYIPPNLAYGKRSMGVIPPNSPLIFKIRLLGVGGNEG